MARLERTDYEAFVGLWLNRTRAIIRSADIVRLGAVAATRPPSKGWFIATHETEDEAIAAYDRAMAAFAAGGA